MSKVASWIAQCFALCPSAVPYHHRVASAHIFNLALTARNKKRRNKYIGHLLRQKCQKGDTRYCCRRTRSHALVARDYALVARDTAMWATGWPH